MVIFEVTNSLDKDQIGDIQIFYERFTLGSSLSSNMIFDEPTIDSTHLVLRLNSEGLLIKSWGENFYFSNGKKIKGAKLHKVGDIFQVGSTELRIKEIEFQNLSESFKSLYQKRLEKNPELEPLITQLQKELIYLDYEDDV